MKDYEGFTEHKYQIHLNINCLKDIIVTFECRQYFYIVERKKNKKIPWSRRVQTLDW